MAADRGIQMDPHLSPCIKLNSKIDQRPQHKTTADRRGKEE